MTGIPADLDTDRQPPMTVPLRHFVVGLAFLLGGVLAGTGQAVGTLPVGSRPAHVHLLLVGWVCVTIMGAMTQFVPVWSGTSLHSRRLANAQLACVSVGVTGFAAAFLGGHVHWVAPFGALMLVGFWTFVYNIARTMATVDSYDVTERHFLLSLLFFLLLTGFGLLLAVDRSGQVLGSFPVRHERLLGAHATLAVFGAVLTTIYGALYQLGTMFTQTELHGLDHQLRAVEEVGHPAGVVLLAAGRLVDVAIVARLGWLLVVAAAVSFGFILVRKLREMQLEWTPMHARYAVVAPALVAWALLSAPAWLARPTARTHLFGGPGVTHLLGLGVVGFVVAGTLYHVVPFIIWVHRYSDRLGFEAVPMVDDLYDDRLATLDFWLLLGGTVLLVGSEVGGFGRAVFATGGVLVSLGAAVFAGNLLLVVRRHSPQSLDRVLLGALSPRPAGTGQDDQTAEQPR